MTLLAFLLVIGVLVTFHEFGHYVAARLCGVRVLTFSVGFGKVLLKRRMGQTEWQLAAVPLGGYVKMLDGREGAIPSEWQGQAFDQRPVWQRMVVVVAGPLANLLLAIVLFSFTMSGAQEWWRPLVGTVSPQSAAYAAGIRAGDEIMAINGQSVADWMSLRGNLSDAIAEGGPVVLRVSAQGQLRHATLPLTAFGIEQLDESSLGRVGLLPVRYLPQIASVLPDGAAARAGLRKGDRLLAIDGRAVSAWTDWVAVIQSSPGKVLKVTYMRNGIQNVLSLRPDSFEQDGLRVGRIGAAPVVDEQWLSMLKRQRQVSVIDAVQQAVARTADLSINSLNMLGAMLTGHVSLQALSGPLTIAEFAGKSAGAGLESLLEFMALISVSLAVFNLLPIPVLDGGHLLYHVVELVRGKPLPDRVLEISQRMGMAIIMMVMLLAIFNDFARLLGQ